MHSLHLLIFFFGSVNLPLCRSDSAIIPPLFRYDKYETHPAVFCSVSVHLKNNASEKESKRLITGFRRDYLEWGIYVKNCENELANVDEENRQELYHPEFPINYRYRKTESYWDEQTKQFAAKYSTLLNMCVNNRLQRDYNLTQRGYSEIQYCLTNDFSDQQFRKDWWSAAFLVIVFTLIAIVLIASTIDWFMVNSHIRGNLVVTSFAIGRNWAHLLKQSNNEISQDFRYIDGLRFCINIFTVFFHCLVVCAALPISNLEQAEKVFSKPISLISVTLAPVSVRSFLLITGMFQAVNFLQDLKQKPKLIYAFYLMYSIVGDRLPGVTVSPTGYISLTIERLICRRHGWRNLLFVNNLPDVESESCFLQGWYLAADQQLFLGSLVLFALIWRFPNKTKILLWAAATISIIVPAIIVYCLEFQSLLPVQLPEVRCAYYYLPWFNFIYQPGYSNMNATMAGIIVGYLYHQSKAGNINQFHLKTYIFIRKVTAAIFLLLFGTVSFFYEHELPYPSLVNTLHFLLVHNCAIVAISLCFIHCFLNPAGIYRHILSSRLLATLGKLSFSVYVLHVPLLRLLLNYIPVPVEVSYSNILKLLFPTAIMSYILGLITYLVIEQPCNILLKHWYLGRWLVKKD